MHSEKCHHELSSYVLRLALGGLLLIVGIGKFSGGVEAFVSGAAPMFDGTLIPMTLAKGFLTLVPLLEVVVGGLLLLGLFTSVAAWVGAFVFALFIVGLATTGKPEMVNNFILLFATVWLAKLPSGRISLDHLVGMGK